jgi:transcriptional regulator with GAF, ATPase, and Fis domain
VAVNCGAIPDTLVESELFGHKKGAFSGAAEDRVGLVRSAHGGTLFLDEVGDLPLGSQAALLRVLQEKEVMPVGASRPVPVDTRVVAATHRDLDDMVERGEFRQDLFARLAGFTAELPPLRDRREDLGLLFGSLLARHVGEVGEHPGIDPVAARALYRYPWPRNVRELDSALATALVLAAGKTLTLEHLPGEIRAALDARPAQPPPAPVSPAATSGGGEIGLSAEDRALRDELVSHLRHHAGNVSAVARAMGKDRKQIQRWVKRFGLTPESFR